MNRTIEIVVAPNGQTELQTKGFVGSSCQAASQFLQEALGLVTSERRTSEYFQVSETPQAIRVAGPVPE